MEFLDVATGHEVVAGAGDDDDLHTLRLLQFLDAREEGLAHFQPERIHRLRTVQGQGGEGAADVQQDLLVHFCSSGFPAALSSRRW